MRERRSRVGLIKAAGAGETPQDKLLVFRAYEEDPYEQSYIEADILKPDYSPKALLDMVEYSTILQQCVDAYKRNIPGFGTELRYREDETVANETPEMKKEWDLVTNWLKYFNFDKSFKDVWEQAIEHRERCGNAYIEVLRDGAGRVAGGDNVDPEFMRCGRLGDPVPVTYATPIGEFQRKKRFRKYAQRMLAGNIVWFKEFGDPRFMNCVTGKYTTGHNGEEEATEILHLKIGDRAYGVPRWIGHLVHIYGARNAEELNYNYFKNGRHTPMAVIVSNGMLTDDSMAQLENYASQIKGTENAHGFLLLEAEGLDESDLPGEESKTGVKVELKPITEIMQQDGLFLEYDKQSGEKVQSAFRLPDLYVGKSKDFNRATADAAKQVTEEQVFEPERCSLEFIINEMMLREYELKHVDVFFKVPIISDVDEKVKLLTVLSALNAIAPNDVREEAGRVLGKDLEPFPIPQADLPMALSSMIAQMEAAAQATAAPEEKGAPDKEDPEEDDTETTDIEKAMESKKFIALLKDIRDEVNDYNAVLKKIRDYSEATGASA